MQLTPWHPFRDLNDFFGRSTRFIKGGVPSLRGDNENGSTQWAPSADISESKKEYLIKAELPDVDKSDIHVSICDGALRLEGERRHEEEVEGETFHRIESSYGHFSRVFSLPDNIDEAKIKAESKNGILRIRIPKTAESAPESATEIPVS